MSNRNGWLVVVLGLVGSVAAACSTDTGKGSPGTNPDASSGGSAAGGATNAAGGNPASGGATNASGGSTNATGGSASAGGGKNDAGASTGGASSGGADAGSLPDSGAALASGGSGGTDAATAGPAVTAVGSPIDGVPFASAAIGAAGGTLTSGDGQVVLTIPAGALAATTTIGIQAIGNFVPGATGYAYRFTPDGQTFAKAVTLKFAPTYGQLDGSSIDHVGLAFQDANREWDVVPVVADVPNKTVTATTTHFTDYGYLLDLQLSGNNALFTGQATFLHVTSVPTDGNLVGPAASVALTGNPTWLLDGSALGNGSDGSLDPLANAASYTAPSQIPSTDPVSVSVSYLASGGAKVTLVTELYILAHKYHLDVTLINDAVCAGGSGYTYDYSTKGGIDLTLDALFDITSENPTAATTPTITGVGVCNGVPCTATGQPAKSFGLALTTVSGGWQPLLRRLWLKPQGDASGSPDLAVSCPSNDNYEVKAANDPWNAPGYIGYLAGKNSETASSVVTTPAFTAGPSFKLTVVTP